MTRRALFTCAVFLAVGAAVALVHGDPGHPARRTGGPLACEDCGRSATAVPVHIGEPVSMGPLFLRNETDKSIRIERVELLGVDPGLELIGLLAVEPDGRHPFVGGDRGFPPPGSSGTRHAVPGYQLAPAHSKAEVVQILFGLRLTRPGRAGARRIAVDYRVGDVPYRAYFDHSMWLCTPRYRKVCIDPSW
jgi:hypothetical protein